VQLIKLLFLCSVELEKLMAHTKPRESNHPVMGDDHRVSEQAYDATSKGRVNYIHLELL